MCSIVGTWAHEASYLTYLGLHSLQHRGQEASGIISVHGDACHVHRRRGLVSEAFQNGAISHLKGLAAIGHTRYSTTGEDNDNNIQPLHMLCRGGWVSLAHNGNLVNADTLRNGLEEDGAIFQTTTDTEVIMHLIAKCKGKDLVESVICALEQVEGSYSLLVMDKDKLIAVRDPHGFRPLVYGECAKYPVFASESCVFDLMGGEPIREVEPGEMFVVDIKTGKVETRQVFPKKKLSRCVFEMIYFARPDSKIFDKSVYEIRKALGRRLAQEQPAKADVVVPVPDSGISAALGYAQELEIPYEMGIIRSHYVGRVFIKPKQEMRDLGVRLKLNAVRSAINNKKIVVIDDSLVRGTTSKKIITMLREAGAKEVHLRISCPPTISPCFYGIDTPTKEELLASSNNIDEIKEFVGADSVGYLSLEGLYEVTGNGFCNSCFSGDYPTITPLCINGVAVDLNGPNCT